jgi:hypothetical protein
MLPERVPCTATRAPTVTALAEALVRPLRYVVDDCSSTVTVVPVRSVTVKLAVPSFATVPTTPEAPSPPKPRPPPAPADPDPPGIDAPGPVADGAVAPAGAGVFDPRANAIPITVKASTAATAQAVLARRNHAPTPRRAAAVGSAGCHVQP